MSYPNIISLKKLNQKNSIEEVFPKLLIQENFLIYFSKKMLFLPDMVDFNLNMFKHIK